LSKLGKISVLDPVLMHVSVILTIVATLQTSLAKKHGLQSIRLVSHRSDVLLHEAIAIPADNFTAIGEPVV
jgi:hypothetical protein